MISKRKILKVLGISGIAFSGNWAFQVKIWHEGAFKDFSQNLRLFFQMYEFDDILKFDIPIKFEHIITNFIPKFHINITNVYTKEMS